ncbi:MAG: CoA transferase [Ectothiorhodospiraceae bacterium]|nr:CoA transferase [Ectothiorhodospiraceae bacterium]
MSKPALLDGVRIIDMTSVVFGPYCTQMLSDMGADVVKVEPPRGDQFRIPGKPARTPLMGPGFFTINRGKRSVVLDLKKADDRDAMNRLLRSADVFIHNVREQAITRLGFGFEQVSTLKPDLIYVHCVGFGSGGPYSGLQAYDDVIQAASGLTSLMGRYHGDERPRYVPSTIADKVAGLYASQAVLAAVIHRLRTGEGQHVEVPMFEAFTQFLLQEHLWGHAFEPPAGEFGYFRQTDPNRQPFPTADGYISIVPYTDDVWLTMLELLDSLELTEDPRFSSPEQRRANMTLLYRRIGEKTPRHTTAEWLVMLRQAQIPAMPVVDFESVRDDPHLWATGLFQRRTHPTEGDYVEMPLPLRFSAAPRPTARPAPLLGEHTDEVLTEVLGKHDR